MPGGNKLAKDLKAMPETFAGSVGRLTAVKPDLAVNEARLTGEIMRGKIERAFEEAGKYEVKTSGLGMSGGNIRITQKFNERTEQLKASNGTMTTTGAYANKAGNWLPERRDLHNRLVTDATEAAVKQSQHQTGEPAIHAMRGNTGAGKTRATKGKEELHNMPVVNADLFKQKLIQNTDVPVVNQQVHSEGAMLAGRFKEKLLDPETGVKSFMVDGRLGNASDVQKLAEDAQKTGRKLNVYDVDAPLEQSLIGVLMRKHGGPDPVVESFGVIGERGFLPARANREKVMELFEKNPDLGRYELYGTKPNGDKALVVKVENGQRQIIKKEKEYYNKLTDGASAERQIVTLKNTKINDAEISRVTKDLPESDWKQSVIETLNKYKGLTWEEAIAKHGKP